MPMAHRWWKYIFVAAAWVNSGDLRLVKLFPLVVKVDDTSRKKSTHIWHSLVKPIVGMFSHGWEYFCQTKQLVRFVRCFIWCYLSWLVSLYCNRYIILAGDWQEISQLDNAIHDCYPLIQRVRCGWHIVEKGWQKHCPGERSLHGPLRDPFKKFLMVVKKWI